MITHVIRQGETCEIRIRNVRVNGVLVTDWTGYSVKSQVRERVESTTVLHEWTSEGPTANVEFEDSDVRLLVTPAVSTVWTWTTGRYDVELTAPGGATLGRIDQGHIIIDREITRE